MRRPHELTENSNESKPIKKRRRKRKYVRKQPLSPPRDLSECEAFLAKLNATFALNLTADSLSTSREGVLGYLDYLKLNVGEADWPLMLQESMEYAKYRIAQRFGLLDNKGDDPLCGYATIKSRYVELVGG